eukprot:4957289-Amphidinium_carterae.1
MACVGWKAGLAPLRMLSKRWPQQLEKQPNKGGLACSAQSLRGFWEGDCLPPACGSGKAPKVHEHDMWSDGGNGRGRKILLVETDDIA